MSDFSTRRVMMVDTQVRPSDVTKFPIIAAMLAVPRESFVPAAQREAAYVGANVALSPNRVVLEARSLAKLLDFLDIQPGDRVMDLAAGYGYAAAVLAEMGCDVVAVEEDAAMAEAGRTRLAGQARMVTAPLTAGAPEQGPYDAIVVQGAVEQIPDTILAQLNEGGRIGALFMQGPLGTARIGLKQDGVVNWRNVFNATAPVLPGFAARRGFVL
ncbi:MAG: protein-L-isoaspartate O-methyltransferase [Candidatus Saccharibacteria bacterium]|nr:protein-L-isoaspartate O-methyltransferase [Pseudorhodobacter sp.]